MTGTVIMSLNCSVENDAFRDDPNITPISFDQTLVGGGNPGMVDIGTSEEDISFGDITPGFVIIQNMDATNYVQIGPKSGGAMIAYQKIRPGRFALIELDAGVTMRAKANTATVRLRIRGYAI